MKDSIEHTIKVRKGAKRARRLASEAPDDIRRAVRRVGHVVAASKAADLADAYAHRRPLTLITAAGLAGVLVGVAVVLRATVLSR